MILRDALVDNLELYESKSHKILSESVWRQLDEDTKNYVNRWEQELWPLLEEYEQLTEAELTADQILGIFGQAEKFAVDSGKYQTKAGAHNNTRLGHQTLNSFVYYIIYPSDVQGY